MWKAIVVISLGSAFRGALLRWGAGNAGSMHCFPAIPPGTLAANLIGGYIIGLAVAYFAQAPEISPEFRASSSSPAFAAV